MKSWVILFKCMFLPSLFTQGGGQTAILNYPQNVVGTTVPYIHVSCGRILLVSTRFTTHSGLSLCCVVCCVCLIPNCLQVQSLSSSQPLWGGQFSLQESLSPLCNPNIIFPVPSNPHCIPDSVHFLAWCLVTNYSPLSSFLENFKGPTKFMLSLSVLT